MSIRDDAIADILAATSPEVLGREVTIDETPVSAVKKAMTAEEVSAFGFDGISTQGTRLTLSADALSAIPVCDQQLDVDGTTWNVFAVKTNGNLLRLTLTRYVS